MDEAPLFRDLKENERVYIFRTLAEGDIFFSNGGKGCQYVYNVKDEQLGKYKMVRCLKETYARLHFPSEWLETSSCKLCEIHMKKK